MKSITVGASRSRERVGVVALAVLIVLTLAIYVALRSSALESTGAGGSLMPYQTLVRDLPSADQTTYADMYRQFAGLENARAVGGTWPEATTLGVPSYQWSKARQGFYLNYLARPEGDSSNSAWLLVIQEPDPLATPDPAPNDETHHRLPDGTVLHVGVWTHRFGGQVPADFVRQPEATGWTQVLTAPVPPVAQTPPARTGVK
jgi:hypothetical protein